jgi:hypothetical protein
MRTRPASLLLLPAAALVGSCYFDNDDGPGVQMRTHLVQYQSCEALEADLEDMMIENIEAQIEQYGSWGGPPEAGEDDGADDPQGGDGREEGEDYSGTNNQEDGVDEADFLKTDGYHIYTLNGNRLHIFGVPEFGTLEPESVTDIEGHPTQMLVDRDAGRAVVFSIIPVWNLPEDHPLREHLGEPTEDGGWYWRSWDVTKITVLDVSDRTSPQLLRELFVEGWYQTARKHETSVRLATHTWVNNAILWDWWSIYNQYEDPDAGLAAVRQAIRDLPLDDLVPRYYVRTPDGNLEPNALTTSTCSQFYRPTDSHAYGMTSLYSLDLQSADLDVDADNVVSNWPTVYASTDTLVLTEPAHGWWWFWDHETDPEQLNVHAFDVSEPGETRYLASGRVEGLLFDQFSIDEENGYIRLATTDNRWARWWDEEAPDPDNHIFVLDHIGDELVTVGHVGGIAPNESIFAARFVGDRGFLVTFEQIDPLFTIDLRNPYAPEVVGELEVPGFSTYLHKLANGRLLAIGVGGDEEGADWGQTQISLFDTSDFANPALQDRLALQAEGDWSWSEALWEHKAFQYWAPKELLAVPVSSYREIGDPEGDGTWEWEYLSRLELINVSLTEGLSRKGSIDHSHMYSSDEYWYYRDVRRSIFMGDYLYAISDRGISVHLTSTLETVDEEPLPGYSPDDWYWWW